MDISIIVPLFNEAESLTPLYEWIDRVMKANHFSYEVIFVNDGSKDGSAIICDKLALNPKVRVIHQDNRGASTARNVGLSLAQGDYV